MLSYSELSKLPGDVKSKLNRAEDALKRFKEDLSRRVREINKNKDYYIKTNKDASKIRQIEDKYKKELDNLERSHKSEETRLIREIEDNEKKAKEWLKVSKK